MRYIYFNRAIYRVGADFPFPILFLGPAVPVPKMGNGGGAYTS